MNEINGKSRRGFASMTPERRKEISSMGGKSVNPANRAFAKNKELAKAAGRQGGRKPKITLGAKE
jgi:general stress protein YciG